MQIYVLCALCICCLSTLVRAEGWVRVMPLIPINGPSWFIPSKKGSVETGELVESPSVIGQKPDAQVTVGAVVKSTGPTVPPGQVLTISPPPVQATGQPTVAPPPGQVAIQSTIAPAPGQIAIEPTLAPSPGQIAVEPTLAPSPGHSAQPVSSPVPGQTTVQPTLAPPIVQSTVPSSAFSSANPTTAQIVVEPSLASTVNTIAVQPTAALSPEPLVNQSTLTPLEKQTNGLQVSVATESLNATGSPSQLSTAQPAGETTQPALSSNSESVTIQPTTVPADNQTVVQALVEPTLALIQPTPNPSVGPADLSTGYTLNGTTIAFHIDTTQPDDLILLDIPTIQPFEVLNQTGTPSNSAATGIGPQSTVQESTPIQTSASQANTVTQTAVPSTGFPFNPFNGTTIASQIDDQGIELEIPTIEQVVNQTVAPPNHAMTDNGIQMTEGGITQILSDSTIMPTNAQSSATLLETLASVQVGVNQSIESVSVPNPTTASITNPEISATTVQSSGPAVIQTDVGFQTSAIPLSTAGPLLVSTLLTTAGQLAVSTQLVGQQSSSQLVNVVTGQPVVTGPASATPGVAVTVFPKKVDGSIPNRAGFNFVQTSGKSSPCLKSQDCFILREPNEWCPMPDGSNFVDRGCFCDKSISTCVIERTVKNGKEWTFCNSKSESRCV